MTDSKDINTLVLDMCQRAKSAAVMLRSVSSDDKESALQAAAEAVWRRRDDIIAANKEDMVFGRGKGLNAALLDRLMLDEARIKSIMSTLLSVAKLPDPVGEVMAKWDLPTGLSISRVRTPLGVIGVIYESRPNVTIDAGALCLKSGNAVILRGGSESFNSSKVLHECLKEGLMIAGLPEAAIQKIPTRDRAAVSYMLGATGLIDVIIPRGGKALVELVRRNARVPVFAHLEGICHVYIDKDADPKKASKVVMNAKTRRPGICGAAECLLIHREAKDLGQQIIDDLIGAGVEVRAGPGLRGSVVASESDFGKEFLDMVIATKIVDDLDAAMAHIEAFGSGHTDCIITGNDEVAARFMKHLDSAILMRNASTQFADGGEFGMGAEIGISTGKFHARGPVGASQLTSFKYLVEGNGTVRA